MAVVFAYGTLMFPRVWGEVLKGSAAKPLSARITGFARFRIRGEIYPGLARQSSAQTDGVLYRPVGASELAILDGFEGSDYQRITVLAMPTDEPCAAPIKAYAYLYLRSGKLETNLWHPEHFRRNDLDDFINAEGLS